MLADRGKAASEPLQPALLLEGQAEYLPPNPNAGANLPTLRGEVKDYGGHRGALNPNGITLKDVWTDIPPVRHWKFKSKNRKANALSTKLLDRVVEMSTVEGDLVLDPFGGSGTTFSVCEDKGRRWIGMEIDFAPEIIERLESDEIHSHKNDDFIEA